MPIPHLTASTSVGLAASLGALSFNTGAGLDGIEWGLAEIAGWDSPLLRTDIEDRALAHGASRGPSFYGVRELTLSGLIVSEYGLTALRAALDELAFETDLTDTDGLLVVQEDPAKQCSVRRAGSCRVEILTDYLARFEVDLTATDPRKYAAVERSVTLEPGETVDAANAGTFRSGAPLRIVFSGAGDLAVGDEVVAAVAPVEIDTLEGTAQAGGVNAFSHLGPFSAFPFLPARSSTPLTFSGSGVVTVTWRDAWV